MTQLTQEEKEAWKTKAKLARAQGLLMAAKQALLCLDDDEVAKDRLIKLIDEVLELLK